MKRLGLPQAAALLLCVSLLSTIVLVIFSSDLGSGDSPKQQLRRTPRDRFHRALNVVRTAYNFLILRMAQIPCLDNLTFCRACSVMYIYSALQGVVCRIDSWRSLSAFVLICG